MAILAPEWALVRTGHSGHKAVCCVVLSLTNIHQVLSEMVRTVPKAKDRPSEKGLKLHYERTGPHHQGPSSMA